VSQQEDHLMEMSAELIIKEIGELKIQLQQAQTEDNQVNLREFPFY
jgi:hypothetical protein